VTDSESTGAARRTPIGRRRLLAGAGASGLAAAITVFGRPGAAFADNYHCCNLIFSPPNISMSSCKNVSQEKFSNYIWVCNRNGYRCSCCEHYTYDTVTGSAATCSRT
jgi:hypothetical protein